MYYANVLQILFPNVFSSSSSEQRNENSLIYSQLLYPLCRSTAQKQTTRNKKCPHARKKTLSHTKWKIRFSTYKVLDTRSIYSEWDVNYYTFSKFYKSLLVRYILCCIYYVYRIIYRYVWISFIVNSFWKLFCASALLHKRVLYAETKVYIVT